MKEAFWGALIIILGLFGIVVVNIFQNVTVDNDRVYYLIKESTEAAALDALDLTYYRLTGDLRIVEDKFAENLTRRFAENVTIGDYTIIVEDINEMPPKISLRVRSGITSLNGEEFGIVNRVDAILETKYSLEEVLTFLGITQEEWIEYSGETKIEVDAETGENVCKAQDINQEMECITGDLMFIGFEDVTLQNAVCQDESAPTNVVRKAKYKTCECGKWIDASENVVANPVKVGNEHVYTWNFSKTSEVRTITGSIKGRVSIEECTIGIGVLVPNDLGEVNQDTVTSDGKKIELPYSPDNSKYTLCPAEGIRIPVGMSFVAKPDYNPKTSVNRYVDWSSSDDTILTVSYNGISREGKTSEQIENAIKNHPISTCALNKEGTNCLLTSIVTAKEVGTTYVNVETTRGQTATCKVEVFDGNVESLSCEDLTLEHGTVGVFKRNFAPLNATILDFNWSIDDSEIATINENTGEVIAMKGGSATVTIAASNGVTGTCKLTVKNPPNTGGGSSSGGGPSSGSCTCPYTESNVQEVCETIKYTVSEYCGKKSVSYKYACGTYNYCYAPGQCTPATKYCNGTRLEPKYCDVEKEKTECSDKVVSTTKYATGSIKVNTSYTYPNGKTCSNWSSYCQTSKSNCNYRNGQSCW